jgi:hypothetical protein
LSEIEDIPILPEEFSDMDEDDLINELEDIPLLPDELGEISDMDEDDLDAVKTENLDLKSMGTVGGEFNGYQPAEDPMVIKSLGDLEPLRVFDNSLLLLARVATENIKRKAEVDAEAAWKKSYYKDKNDRHRSKRKKEMAADPIFAAAEKEKKKKRQGKV